MAATWAGANLIKTVWGNKKVVIGGLIATGTYTSNGDTYDLTTITDNYLTELEGELLVTSVGSDGTNAFYLFKAEEGAIMIFGAAGAASHTHTFTSDAGGTGATGAEAAHTHTIAVTAGTAGNAVTNNAGVLESSGGQDLTTSAGSSHTHTGPSHTHTGTTAAASVTTASALAQIANGTDITGWVCTFMAIGH